MPVTELSLRALAGIPAVKPGDNLALIIMRGLEQSQIALQAGDVLIVSSKIVSKANNRFVDLEKIQPSERATTLAQTTHKDPRFVELVLRESVRVSRAAPNALIVQHRLGFTSANAGIDQSNTGYTSGNMVLLLPEDPDASAAALASTLEAELGIRPAIVISDTHGRPFRIGNINVAIGIDGLPPLYDQRGQSDLYGRTLQATVTAFCDQIASAAGLLMGEADEGQPVVLMRGLRWPADQIGRAHELVRPSDQDLYR